MSNKTAYIFCGQGFAFSELNRFRPLTFPSDLATIYERIFKRELKPLQDITSLDYQRNEISAAILMTSAFVGLSYPIPKPEFMAGYSVGQYIALYAANALTRPELIHLVFKRCKYMNEAASLSRGSMMTVLGLGFDVVAELAEAHDVWVSIDNAPGNITVSGDVEALKAFSRSAQSRGAYKIKPLYTTGAWHCPLMAPSMRGLADVCSEVDWKRTDMPVIDNVTSSEFDIEKATATLSLHLTRPVRWRETVQYLAKLNVNNFIEITQFDLLKNMGPFITRKASWRSAHDFERF